MVIRMRKSNWRRWRIVINFVVVILLYGVLTLEVLFHWEGLYVPTTNHILQMFGEGCNITSFPGYYKYLSTVIIPALNRKLWYNGKPMTPHKIWMQQTGYTRDYMSRLMSRPRLRQQRVRRDSCQVVPMMKERFNNCYAPLSSSSMEDVNFSVSWGKSHKPAKESGDPWTFSDSNSPLLICGYQTEKCYFPGGYIGTLDYNRTTSESILTNLSQSRWLDEATRVVFLELVMYNTHTDLMSYVALMLERLADGSFQFHVKDTNLHSRPTNYAARLAIVLSFTFYYFCRTVLLFNRRGLAYLFSSIGLLDIFLNIFLHVTMISMTFYNEARKAYISKWRESDEGDLVMTSDIFVHRAVLRYETAILVIILPAQVLHNFRFGRRYVIVFKTLVNYLKYTLGLGAVWSIFYFALLPHDFFTLKRIFGWFSYGSFQRQIFQFYSIIFYLITNFVVIFAIVTGIMCYRKAKLHFKYSNDFNMIFFILKKLNYFGNNDLKIFRKWFGLRVRAGADGVDLPPVNRTRIQVRQMCSDLSSKCDVLMEKVMDMEKVL